MKIYIRQLFMYIDRDHFIAEQVKFNVPAHIPHITCKGKFLSNKIFSRVNLPGFFSRRGPGQKIRAIFSTSKLRFDKPGEFHNFFCTKSYEKGSLYLWIKRYSEILIFPVISGRLDWMIVFTEKWPV